jgi:predicted  nucleic acid-binding Zn-ribbon protein
MGIKDRDVRNALETLDTEFENLEAVIKDKDSEIDELEETISALQQQVCEYENRIKELEEALAEAYLTSEDDNGQTVLHSRHSRETGSSDETVE